MIAKRDIDLMIDFLNAVKELGPMTNRPNKDQITNFDYNLSESNSEHYEVQYMYQFPKMIEHYHLCAVHMRTED